MLEKEAVCSFSILIEDENHVLNTVTFTDGTVSFEDAVETLSKYIPKQFIPDEIIQLSRFEYLPNGKLNVSFLKNAFLNSRKQFIHDIESHNKNGSIESELLDIISCYTKQPIKPTDFDLDLSQIGIDSINHIKVLVDIENRFEFEFEYEEMDMLTHTSLNTLIDVVKRKVN